MHLQNEIHRKAIAFFTHEFDAIIIPSFEVSIKYGKSKNKKDYSYNSLKNA